MIDQRVDIMIDRKFSILYLSWEDDVSPILKMGKEFKTHMYDLSLLIGSFC